MVGVTTAAGGELREMVVLERSVKAYWAPYPYTPEELAAEKAKKKSITVERVNRAFSLTWTEYTDSWKHFFPAKPPTAPTSSPSDAAGECSYNIKYIECDV